MSDQAILFTLLLFVFAFLIWGRWRYDLVAFSALMIAVVAGGAVHDIGPTLRDLYAQGVAPVTLCIGAMRHFRRLHQVASDPGGPGQGVGKLRPPVFGPRRDALARQASTWGRDRLERALTALTETDLAMRSASHAPAPPWWNG